MHSLSKHENEPCLTCMSRICGYCHIYGCLKKHIWNTYECMTTSYVWYASCFHMCDLTHSCMWCDNDSFMWDMAHSRACWVSVLSDAVCSWLVFGVAATIAASCSVLMAHLISPRMSLVCRRVLMAHSRCCSVLQCVAVCSWLILGAAVCCSVLMADSVSQSTSLVCCRVLPCVAVWCSVLMAHSRAYLEWNMGNMTHSYVRHEGEYLYVQHDSFIRVRWHIWGGYD